MSNKNYNIKYHYRGLDMINKKVVIGVGLCVAILCAVPFFVHKNSNKNILLPHLAEYMRIGEAIERNAACIYSILNRHVHSTNRVWIPIFSAKSLFQSIVGHLDEERFGNSLIEIENPNAEASVFRALAYSSETIACVRLR